MPHISAVALAATVAIAIILLWRDRRPPAAPPAAPAALQVARKKVNASAGAAPFTAHRTGLVV